jgi:hypothetical protein
MMVAIRMVASWAAIRQNAGASSNGVASKAPTLKPRLAAIEEAIAVGRWTSSARPAASAVCGIRPDFALRATFTL